MLETPPDDRRNIYGIVALVLGALPLGIYPAVLAGNVMQWAAGGGPRTMGQFLFNCVLFGSTVYPVVYLWAATQWRRAARTSDATRALRYALAPLLFLACL